MKRLIDELRKKIETDPKSITPYYLRWLADRVENCPKLFKKPKLFRVLLSDKLKKVGDYYKNDCYDKEESLSISEVFEQFADDLLCDLETNIPFGLENVITSDEDDFYELPLGYDENNGWCMFVAGNDCVMPVCGILYMGIDRQLHIYIPEEGNMLKDGMPMEDDDEIEMKFNIEKILQDIKGSLNG